MKIQGENNIQDILPRIIRETIGHIYQMQFRLFGTFGETNSKNQRDKLQNTLEEENNKKCIPHQFSFVYNKLKEVVL